MKASKDKKPGIGSGFLGLLKAAGSGNKTASSGWPLRVLGGLVLVPVLLLLTAMVQQQQRQGYLDPQEELDSFRVADGLEVTLFAAEPMLVNPTQMNWDTDGRLWVVSSTAYPHLKTGEAANDKIYVLEDTNGDGKADKSTIFAEGLFTPTGILPGDGGVYVANSTEILHFTDTDGDGKADKKRRVLSGFGTADTHHLIHTFRWGPEGLFYFNQSIYIYSHVETPAGVRRLEGGGVWQLRPKTLDLEVYAKGLVNPWGLQFDRWGQSFLTDGAGGEGINYAFPGATFLTSPGAERILRGLNPGQPKHSGLEVVSGRHLPESWRGTLVANDFRANRINRFRLEEQGSGYASKQVEDVLWTDHVAFRPVDILMGPDGALYVADWYNPIIQHGEVDFHDPRRDQQHGRIWRITAKGRPLVKAPSLPKAPVQELLEALKQPEDWTRTQAKQVLKARGSDAVLPVLQKWVSGLDQNDPDHEHHLLEALWVHQSLEVVNEPLLLRLLNAKSHNARAAGLRALQLWHPKIADVPGLLAKAVADPHPQVRLEAVIALRKTPSAEAARAALSVVEKPMDEFLDFALWQTTRELEPLWMKRLQTEPDFFGTPRQTAFALKSVRNPAAVPPLLQLYQKDQVPEEYRRDVLSAIARSGSPADLNILLDMAVQDHNKQGKNAAAQLGALGEAARQRGVKPDQNLPRVAGFIHSEDEAVAIPAVQLIGYWRLEGMSDQLVNLIHKRDKNIKRAAMGALAALDKNKAEKLLLSLAGGKNPADLRLLATAQLVPVNVTEAARAGGELLRTLPPQADAAEFFRAFLSHKQGTRALADELLAKKIPENIAKAIRPTFERQIPWGRHQSEDVKLMIRALEASGGVRPAERMAQQLSGREINSLAIEIKGSADHNLGEAIFRKSNCASCHGIGGAGGLIGPDLSSLGTSSPVETIIKSILFPAESIKEGYELQRVVKKDGSEMMGYLVSDGSSEIVLRDVTGKSVSVPKSQIEKVEKIPGSLMPPGLTAGLEKEEFMHLVGFLSKLGESGEFRVPNARFVRRWETVPTSAELAKRVSEGGPAPILQQQTKITFQPAYSKVSGDLPLEELPVINGKGNQRYSFVRFDLEVLSQGNVHLAMNSAAGITAWAGQKPLPLGDKGVVADFAPGIHHITLAIDRQARPKGPLSIQIQDPEHAPAQTRLVMGQ
jgi:putative heme-binding domain-containing protein